MKRVIVTAAVVALVAAALVPPAQARQVIAEPGAEAEYVVLYTEGARPADAQRAIRAAGGSILKENTAVGVATVTTTNTRFAEAVRDAASIDDIAHNRSIGSVPPPGGESPAARRFRPGRWRRPVTAPPPPPPSVVPRPPRSRCRSSSGT